MLCSSPGREAVPEQGADQGQHQQTADRPQLGEGLQVERVGIEHGHVDRAVLVPGEPVGPGADPEHRLFGEGVDRDPPEVVATGAGELAEMLRRLVRELDVGGAELVPGATTDRDRDADRQHRTDQR